jgi:CRISPR-associated endonuclease/helicase Cas3
VPTGAGKTLAALGWALALRQRKCSARGDVIPIIYALPFTSIIDQNSAVLASICGPDANQGGALAIHHLLADYGDLALREGAWSARSWAEAWKTEIVSTTFVQVFNALFHGRAADARRFTRFRGRILILDEVQAVPARLWPVTRLALTTLARSLRNRCTLGHCHPTSDFFQRSGSEIAPEIAILRLLLIGMTLRSSPDPSICTRGQKLSLTRRRPSQVRAFW